MDAKEIPEGEKIEEKKKKKKQQVWQQREEAQRGQLTLEMESLLVHSDGECAVVLVIYANHSPLGKHREGGKQLDTSYFTFSFPSSCPPYVPAAHKVKNNEKNRK